MSLNPSMVLGWAPSLARQMPELLLKCPVLLVLVLLSRALTTSCTEFASSGAQASVLCMKAAPQKPGAGSMWAVWCSWHSTSTCSVSLLLCLWDKFCHFLRESFYLRLNFFFFFSLMGEKLITALASLTALKTRSSQELNVQTALKTSISKCQVNVLWEQCDSRTWYEHQIASAATRTCGILWGKHDGEIESLFQLFSVFLLKVKFYFSHACPRHKCSLNLSEMAD